MIIWVYSNYNGYDKYGKKVIFLMCVIVTRPLSRAKDSNPVVNYTSRLVLRQCLAKGDCSPTRVGLVFFGYFVKLCWQEVCSLSRTLPCSQWIRVNPSDRGRALDAVVEWQFEDLLCVALSQIMYPQHGVHYSQSRGLSVELERR